MTRAGNQKARVKNVEFLDVSGAPQRTFRVGQPMKIRVHIEADDPLESPIIDIGFNSNKGYIATALQSKNCGQDLGTILPGSVVEIDVPQVFLAPGGYRISARITAEDLLEMYDWRRNDWEVVVEDTVFQRGAFCMPATWRVVKSTEMNA